MAKVDRTTSRSTSVALGADAVIGVKWHRARWRAAAISICLVCVIFGSPIRATNGGSANSGVRHLLAPEAGSLSLSNWGGYIAPGTADEYTTASADWAVAKVTCRADKDFYAPWVGIDGYGDQTVEQTGVQTACSSGSPVSQAWYEMYPAPPVYINQPVSTGDDFTASVTYSTTTKKFTLTITDVSKAWTNTVTKKLKSAKRMSAEAVIESPDGAYPNIPAVNFTDVLLNGEPLSTFSPVKSKSGTPVTYVPGPIMSGTNFTIAPKK
jgi:peptidase A4-like protein